MAGYPAEHSIPLDELLRHSQWLRPLAHRLLGDGDQADDAVQETYLAALRRPPAASRDLAAWLGGALRNLCFQKLRREKRRERRERRAARPEAVAATSESLLERAEIFRQVVEAVLALDEPYRSSILLRYFGELPPREISRRQAVPLDTVNSRLRRAIEKLRLRLDDSHGGRKVWSAALAGFLGLELAAPAAASGSVAALAPQAAGAGLAKSGLAGSTWILGGMVMTQKMMLVSGVLAAVVLGTGVGIGVLGTHRHQDAGAPAGVDLAARKRNQELEARYNRLLAQFQRVQKAKSAPAAAPSPAAVPAPPAPVEEKPAVATADSATYGLDLLREMIKSNEYKIDILTPDSIEETIEKNGRKASFLVAAALLSKDPQKSAEYLAEALKKEPQSPAALSASISASLLRGEMGEATQGMVADLKSADPTNCLANYYAAAIQFKNGDPAAALNEMREAGAKTHLADYTISHLPASESFFGDAGASPALAKAMAAVSSRVDSLPLLLDLSKTASREAGPWIESGNTAEALPYLTGEERLGSQLSASGRFMISDIVGIRIENEALDAEKKILEAEGQAQGARSDEIARRLGQNGERLTQLRSVSAAFPALVGDLSEAEMVEYLNRMAAEGEGPALADLQRRKG